MGGAAVGVAEAGPVDTGVGAEHASDCAGDEEVYQ